MQNDIGSTLKKVRKSKGLTQQQLAEKSNLSRTYLSDVENNRYNPSIAFIKSVSEGLVDGDENSSKEIYTTLLNALGYVEEQTPIEKAVSEYLSATGFLSSTVHSYKSSQLHLGSLKEYIEKTELNDDRMKELNDQLTIHEHKIKENEAILPMILQRLNELELLIKDGMEYQKNKVNELLTTIGYQNLNK